MNHDGALSFHLFLSLAILPSCFLSLTLNPTIIQSSIFNLYLPLALFLAISVPKIFLSIPPSLLNSCPMKLHCFLLIVVKSCLSVPNFSKTTSFASFSVHYILNIFLQNHISVASSLFFHIPAHSP